MVSIIVPVYNAEKYISESIRSVQNQNFDNWEIICIDDGSTDNSVNIIKSFHDDRIKYFANEGNNHLLAMSYAQYGTYIYFFIGALSLSVFVILVSRLVDNRYFAKYGKYTLPIYAFHLVLVFVPDFLFKILHVDMSALPEIKGVVYGTIVLGVSCLLIPLIRKIDSNLIGEHK